MKEQHLSFNYPQKKIEYEKKFIAAFNSSWH